MSQIMNQVLPVVSIAVSGQFSDETDQKPANTDVAVITFNKVNAAGIGVSYSAGVFTFSVTARCALLLQPQWERTSGGAVETVDFFAQKDTGSGFVKMEDTNIKETLGNQASGVSTLVVVDDFNAGDKIRFMQKISATGFGLGIKFTDETVDVSETPSAILSIIPAT